MSMMMSMMMSMSMMMMMMIELVDNMTTRRDRADGHWCGSSQHARRHCRP
jgi:hypothetical protein